MVRCHLLSEGGSDKKQPTSQPPATLRSLPAPRRNGCLYAVHMKDWGKYSLWAESSRRPNEGQRRSARVSRSVRPKEQVPASGARAAKACQDDTRAAVRGHWLRYFGAKALLRIFPRKVDVERGRTEK